MIPTVLARRLDSFIALSKAPGHERSIAGWRAPTACGRQRDTPAVPSCVAAASKAAQRGTGVEPAGFRGVDPCGYTGVDPWGYTGVCPAGPRRSTLMGRPSYKARSRQFGTLLCGPARAALQQPIDDATPTMAANRRSSFMACPYCLCAIYAQGRAGSPIIWSEAKQDFVRFRHAEPSASARDAEAGRRQSVRIGKNIMRSASASGKSD